MKKLFSIFLALFFVTQYASAAFCTGSGTLWTCSITNLFQNTNDTCGVYLTGTNVNGYGQLRLLLDTTNNLTPLLRPASDNFVYQANIVWTGSGIAVSCQVIPSNPTNQTLYGYGGMLQVSNYYSAEPYTTLQIYTDCTNNLILNSALVAPSNTNAIVLTNGTTVATHNSVSGNVVASFVPSNSPTSYFYYTNIGAYFPSNTWSLAAASFGMTNGDYKIVNSNGVLTTLYMDGTGAIVFTNPFAVSTNQFTTTNQLNTLGLNDTNFALSIGLNATNFALSIGLAGTNNANAISNSLLTALIATNATNLKTNGNGQFLTGITAAQVAGLPTTNQFASTNQLNTLGLNDTNFALSIGLNDTNFTLSIGLAGTNNANAISNSLLTALIATNATSLKTNGNGQFLTGLTPGQTGSQPTNANLTGFASLGTNAFDAAGVASNLVAPLTALIYITITNWTTQ